MIENEIVEVGGGLESIKKGSESECCSTCFVLEERCDKVESDLEAKINDIEQLQRQIVVMQVENDLLKSFPKGSVGNRSVDLMEEVENDKVLKLMVEIDVLNCEKKKAESDVGFWKAKCEELEFRVGVLENHLSSSITGTTDVVVNPVIKTEAVKEEVATPLIHTLNGKAREVDAASGGEILQEKRNERSSRTRKQLNFGEETPDKMAPATPAAGVINISDDDKDDEDQGTSFDQHGPQQSMNKAQELSSRNTRIVKDESEIEDDIMHCYQGTPSLPSKRKRASRIVHSDSGSDADDNVPLHRLHKRDSNVDTLPSHQGRGIPPKKSSESNSNRGIPTTGNFANDATDDSESDSKGESVNGFTVSGSESDLSVADKSSERDEDEIANSNEKSACESDDKSKGDVDCGSILGRKKDHLVKWEFQAEMFVAFGKDPLLCMKAVCALYRQQTPDEKSCQATIYRNYRGFSQDGAARGSILGAFLTDGDPEGGLNKSVEELKEFQPNGLESCRTLATHYSRQLFAMYKNDEDPLWP